MQEERKKICLFGGTFDPIHLGHSYIAEAAIRAMSLDEMIFLPCRQSPHKVGQKHASEKHRLAMCQLATADIKHARVDNYDLTAPEPCYSWRTAEHMKTLYPDAQLFWLMGTDQWQALPRWNRPERLAELVEFIVFTRGEPPTPRSGFQMHSFQGNHPASATQIRNTIGSSHLHTVKDWLHPDVLEYIKNHQLY